MNAQEQFWAGDFGDSYLKRNRVDWRARIPFWEQIIGSTGARSVHEFGCNAGWNLTAIKRQFPHVCVHGTELNHKAATQANAAGLDVSVGSEIDEWMRDSVELVFTSGVLIHIAPENLRKTMQMIVDTSCDYVLAIEYEDIKETEVTYRGHSERLWRRPYGRLYEALGLTLVDFGDAGPGFDSCTYWLLRK